jgi:Protein phosphatase 2C
MGWKAIANSAIGTSHKKTNSPRQDDGHCSIIVEKGIIIGAVSDGAGSAKYSDIGAELAVNTALDSLEDWVYFKEAKQPDYTWEKPIIEEEAKQVFTKVVSDVFYALKTKADEKQWRLRDLYCTLLLFVATPKWITAMQIGDGFIVMRSLDSPDYQLLFVSDKGEYDNETTFVTSQNVLEKMQYKVIESPPIFIFASTDGLEKLAIGYKDKNPHDKFFQPFEEGIKSGIDDEKTIAQWLRSEQVNQRTDDDKTILVCYYDHSTSQPKKDPKKPKQPNQEIKTNSKNKGKKTSHSIEDIETKRLVIQNSITSVLIGMFWNQQYHYSFVDTNKGLISALPMWLFLIICFGLFESINFKKITGLKTTNTKQSLIALILWSILALTIGASLYYLKRQIKF